MTVATEGLLRAEAPTIRSVLRRPSFFLLVLGQTVSQFGDKLHHMALIALVGAGATASTGGIELAKLSVVFTAPAILFGPFAGALVDRWDKRRTMMVCDALRAMLVVSMPVLYAVTGHLWVVYALAFLVFLLGLFFNSAKMALIPDLVDHEELLSANAALTSIGRVATIAGIVGGGIVLSSAIWRRLGWTDYAAGFYLDAATFALSVITLAAVASFTRLGPTHQGLGAAPAPKREMSRGLIQNIRDTRGLVGESPGLRFAFRSLILLALFASTVYVAMTLSVQTVMGRGPRGVGLLGGMLAAGMVAGSLGLGSLGGRISREPLIRTCVLAIGVLMVLAGLSFSFGLFLPIAFAGGALLGPVMIAQDTLLHEHAPPDRRAVVFSTRDVVLAIVFAISAFVVGGAIHVLGLAGTAEPYRWALVVVGATLLLLTPILLRVPRRAPPGLN